jgi:hypothetical protein
MFISAPIFSMQPDVAKTNNNKTTRFSMRDAITAAPVALWSRPLEMGAMIMPPQYAMTRTVVSVGAAIAIDQVIKYRSTHQDIKK